jgi:hypothetical protein
MAPLQLRIIGGFADWGEVEARRSLHQVLAVLRRDHGGIEPPLTVDRDAVAVDGSAVSIGLRGVRGAGGAVKVER